MKVLYLEDDARDADLARRALARSGRDFDLEVAETLGQARALLAAGAGHEVVLADLRLPDGSGLDLLAEIRERALPLAVVILTGQGDETTAVAALKAGADDYLPKRKDYLDRLPTVLEAALENAHARARLEREQAALRATEERYRDLVENSQDLICTHDLAGRILSANRPAERLSGFRRDELLQMTLPDLLAPEVRHEFGHYLAELQATGEAHGVMRIRTAGGEIRYWEYRNSLRSVGEEPPLVRGMARDVTERVLAERALREKTEELERYFDGALDLLCIADSGGHFRRLNREWEATLGYRLDELLGRPFLDFVHSDDQAATRERLSRLAAHQEVGTFVNRYRAKDGSYRWIEWRSYAAGDSIYATARDVTERRQADAVLGQLQHSQKMESVGRLAGGVAHDFNNLLTVINGTAELALAQLGDGDPLRASFEEIRRAGERAAALTRQLLAFSRRQVLETAVLDLNAVVANVEKMLRRLIGEDILLTVRPAADLGKVKADPGQIEQVLMNLAVNARDAMLTGGRLTIESRNVRVPEPGPEERAPVPPGDYVTLSITDTGTGMDEATRELIFEPFFTTKGPGKGTGLGLSTVYGIVQQSGGGISVWSEVGKGSRFSLFLPRVEEPAVGELLPRSAAAAGGGETLLLVEDEDALRRLARRMLESAGYRVLAAGAGEEALRLLERHPGQVDLLLVDIVMPEMSGRELARQVAAALPGIKIVYMSGYTDDTMLRHGLLDESVRFLGKPFTLAELTRKVREALDSPV